MSIISQSIWGGILYLSSSSRYDIFVVAIIITIRKRKREEEKEGEGTFMQHLIPPRCYSRHFTCISYSLQQCCEAGMLIYLIFL